MEVIVFPVSVRFEKNAAMFDAILPLTHKTMCSRATVGRVLHRGQTGEGHLQRVTQTKASAAKFHKNKPIYFLLLMLKYCTAVCRENIPRPGRCLTSVLGAEEGDSCVSVRSKVLAIGAIGRERADYFGALVF